MDAEGNQLFRSRGFSIANHNASDRVYFRAQRDDPHAGLFMSELLTTRSEGRDAVILSRRLDDDAGHFAGVVVATVDLEDLNRLYQAVDAGPGSHIALLREDGTLLVRNPPAPNVIGRQFPTLAAVPAGPDARVINPISGHTDFIAVVPVRNSPPAARGDARRGGGLAALARRDHSRRRPDPHRGASRCGVAGTARTTDQTGGQRSTGTARERGALCPRHGWRE
jgi:hypothetical protein